MVSDLQKMACEIRRGTRGMKPALHTLCARRGVGVFCSWGNHDIICVLLKSGRGWRMVEVFSCGDGLFDYVVRSGMKLDGDTVAFVRGAPLSEVVEHVSRDADDCEGVVAANVERGIPLTLFRRLGEVDGVVHTFVSGECSGFVYEDGSVIIARRNSNPRDGTDASDVKVEFFSAFREAAAWLCERDTLIYSTLGYITVSVDEGGDMRAECASIVKWWEKRRLMWNNPLCTTMTG